MRSRYTAYTRADAGYLARTHDVRTNEAEQAEIERFARSVFWLGLEVLSAEAGGPADDEGVVAFRVRSLDEEGITVLEERSRFLRKGGRWLYTEGEAGVRVQKVERNAPCPCGSGRKFKQCHA
jgi:SEC-C motif-containing protein